MFNDTNEVVESNFLIGPQILRPFKKIIKKVMYPEMMKDANLAVSRDVLDAYMVMGGNKAGYIELLVYSTESLIHYTLDTYELEDELYLHAQDLFKNAVDILKTSHKEFFLEYKLRLGELAVITNNSDGYDEGIMEYWLEALKK